MSNEYSIYYAFVVGEVAPAFWGRSDLSKYDLGAASLNNFFVDYRGGLLSRAGSEFGGFIEPDSGYKLSRFRGTNNDILMVFTEGKLRFMQNNVFQTLDPVTLPAQTAASTLTFVAHGFTTGDMVAATAASGMTDLHGRQFLVVADTVDTLSLTDLAGNAIDLSTYDDLDGTETLAQVYEVALPYLASELYKLDVQQRYNEVRLTHINHPRMILTFSDSTDWQLAEAVSGGVVPPPSVFSGVASDTGSSGTSFGVTSVDDEGVESVVSNHFLTGTTRNYSVTTGSYTLSWDAVPNAASYNIYRGLILPDQASVTNGSQLSYLGSTVGNDFTDNNITPDYTKSPPLGNDPFGADSPYLINVLTPGSGYTNGTSMTLTGGGSGFVGYPVVNTAGEIGGINIVSQGSGYINPTVVLADTGGGTGATFEILTQGTLGETNPALFSVFQQRGIYFSTGEQPASLWASRPEAFDNYDYSTVVAASDGYTFTIDATAVEPIKHVLSIRSGLLIFTDDGIVQLRAESGKSVSGTNALAEPQVYTDVSDTPPIAVDLDVMFLTGNGTALNSLLYTEYTESFKMQDLSILSSHLFSEEKQVTGMTAIANPYKLIYMPRSDGTMLTLTHAREQEVSGWARHTTLGNYKDTAMLNEQGKSYVYQLVERPLNGTWQMCIERIPERVVDLAENYWGVDCGLALPLSEPAASLYASDITGDVELTASADIFTADNVGDIVYYAGGKLEVTGFLTERRLEATYIRDATDYITFGKLPIPQKLVQSQWQIATPQTELRGLWHLEGMCVSISYDGNAILDETVVNGRLTLPEPSTKVYAGLPYECVGASLPLVVPNRMAEGQRNKIFGAVPRLEATRGLEFGASIDDLEELEDRTDEDWGEPIGMRTDVTKIMIDSNYSYNAQVYWRQRYPLPAALLGFVLRSDIGEK